MKFAIGLLAAANLAGCVPTNQEKVELKINPGVEQRIIVERIGVFEDNLAYGSRRGIYIIRDRNTGREYIGLSGVGLAETGLHSDGDDMITDER